MKRYCAVALVALVSYSYAQQSPHNVIYGNDDREEVVSSIDNMLKDKARSVAGMFDTSKLSLQANGTYRVSGSTLISRGFCASERFATQITAPVCTGWLIAPDVLATAGHCVVKSNDCRNYSWAFDYTLAAATDTTTTIPKNSVYKCKMIMSRTQSSSTGEDWALIKLDRAVTDRAPLEYRKMNQGKVSDTAKLVLIGHPKGLPMKIAANALVRSNTQAKYFSATTDSYAGNSGSPVLDQATGIVEGIHVRGEADTITQGSCQVSKVCAENACRAEDATRTTALPLL